VSAGEFNHPCNHKRPKIGTFRHVKFYLHTQNYKEQLQNSALHLNLICE
jgi:hypothetical protein